MSVLRVFGLILFLSAGTAAAFVMINRATATTDAVPEPWYAPYVDATITPLFAFEDATVNPSDDVVLSFIVADADDPCEPSWGAAFGLDEAARELDLDRRIARYRQLGGDVVISFGGAINDELSTVCDDDKRLVDAYRAVVDRYDVDTIDLDIEADDLADEQGAQRRGAAIASLQSDVRTSGGQLAVWLTLPVTPAGMPAEAVAVVDAMLGAGVDVAGVNVMTMNFGEGRDAETSMAEATGSVVDATHRQLAAAYQRIDQRLSFEQIQAKIGVTPMIGQNDDPSDVFRLDDADAVVAMVADEELGRLSMWSLNRDAPCGPNTISTKTASDFCTGLEQDQLEFSETFDRIGGRPGGQAAAVTEPLDGPPPVDDPATAPYPIWDADIGFDQAEKTVWRGNVYEAKWWNQGEPPDAPIVNEWETPWRLIGPVLPTDRPPAPPPSFPDGTFPEWSGTDIYEEGDRVQYRGYGYEAKWWTQGDQPGIDVPNDWDTPWELIVDDEQDSDDEDT